MNVATQNKKNLWNLIRETGNDIVRRKLITQVKQANGAFGKFDMVASTLFWHENVKFAIVPNLQVSLMGFQKIFLFWVPGIILEGWEPSIGMVFILDV